jgi:NADH-quinone oxidoreductase subunit E
VTPARTDPDHTGTLQERRGEGRDPRGTRRPSRFEHGSRVPGWDDAVDLSKPPATVPDAADASVPEGLRAEIEAAMAKYPDRRSAAIPALHAAQQVHGWCSPLALSQVAAVMQLTPAYLTSVASFYDMFAMTPKATHDVFVCTNITCSLLGADEFHEAMIDAARGADVDVRSFECLGACDIAPMASVNGEYVGPLELDDAARIVEELTAGKPVLPEKQIRYRRTVDPGAGDTDVPEDHQYGPPDHEQRADTAGLPASQAATDRPGGAAPIEIPPEHPTTEHS